MKSIVFMFIIVGISSTNAEVTWPSGAYGLPKAKTGCPKSGGMKWKEGWITQDMEDNKGWKSEISSNFHMEARLLGKKDISRTFCMKTEIGTPKREWPKGFYCVYKSSGSKCSKGMKEGSVKWDDENDKNNNVKKGTLPDGTYNKDTTLKYCCQGEGHWYNAVQLPVNRPFYLLPHNSASFKYPKCQLVKWAMSWLDYIKYDTEDTNNRDELKGSHVFVHSSGDSLLKMYYCYYKGCGSNIYRGNTGSFTSRNDHAQFQYCSWLVTVSKNRLVLLSFDNLNVPNCTENFVKIFDGVNDRGRLLKTYCGSNAKSGSTIVSATNNVYVVLKSGTYSKDTGIVVGFEAKYSTQLNPTKSTRTMSTPLSTPLSTARSTPWSTPWSTATSTPRSTAMSLPTKTIVKTTKPSTSRSSPQPESNKESSHNLPVTYIIVPVIAGITIILVIIIIVICIRRRRSEPRNDENDDGYFDAVPGETDEAMSRVIPGSFNTPGEVSHADAADKEDTDGYAVPFQEMSGATPGNQQHYQALDVLRREDEEKKYQSLVGVERFSEAGPSDYVVMPDGAYMELNSNRENGDASYTSLQSKM